MIYETYLWKANVFLIAIFIQIEMIQIDDNTQSIESPIGTQRISADSKKNSN